MAWIDDRIWCHPKFTDLTDRAAWVWVKSVTYSTGFATKGILTPGQQKQVGSDARIRRELLAAGVWDEAAEKCIEIHDWDEHNSKRDARREADRARKKLARARDRADKVVLSDGTSAGLSAGRAAGTYTLPARVDGSEGSEGSEKPTEPGADGSGEVHSLDRLRAAARLYETIPVAGRDEGTERIVLGFASSLTVKDFDDIRVSLERKIGSDALFKAAGAYVNGALQKAARKAGKEAA